MNIRPFGWRDISLLRNYLDRGLLLDSSQALTHGRSLIARGAYLSFITLSNRMYTFRSDGTSGSGVPLLSQISYVMGASDVHLTFLAPEDELAQPEISAISDFLAVQAGKMGAFHILAEVDECSQAYELLHRAGFAIYARQRLWHMGSQPVSEVDPGGWQSCRSKDVIAVRSLYCNVVPGLVQQVEPLPKKDLRGSVYYQGGDLLAFVEMKYGRYGVWVQPFIHPDAGDIDRFLVPLLQHLPGRGNRPVYICIRSYQSWLESAIQAMGAQPGQGQAVMVRHLTVARPVTQSYPVSAINGKRVEPTAPIVQIDGKHYVETTDPDQLS